MQFNLENQLLFFRISSDLVPFASHPVCDLPWQSIFRDRFSLTGAFIRKHEMRVSMHPDQFTLINALDEDIVQRSVRELQYHADVLDALGLDESHKVQIHVGGVYGDKDKSIRRFVERYYELPNAIKRRLVIENDDRLFTLSDCLAIHDQTGVPVVLDNLHHSINSDDTTCGEALARFEPTWRGRHGPPMIDYSSQEPGKRPGAHATSIDTGHFREFLKRTEGYDFDVMCEIKDKEASALKALRAARSMQRA